MLVLYGRHYLSRYRIIADMIPDRASVLDVCCGPGVLYTRYLAARGVEYAGLDVNEGFIRKLRSKGVAAKVWDVRDDAALPSAEYVLMQASLYHFLPDARPVVDRLVDAARKQVIIAEPITNLATSQFRLIARLGRRLTDSGHGEESRRFTEASLDEFFMHYGARVKDSFLIPGGREKVYVMEGEKGERMKDEG